MSAEFAKKVIEETGFCTKQDWVSINEGPWKSCTCLKDVKFKEDIEGFDIRSGVTLAHYDESIFNKFHEICNGDENEIENLADGGDFLASFKCFQSCPVQVGLIAYSIIVSKHRVGMCIEEVEGKEISKYVSLNAEDKYGNKLSKTDKLLFIDLCRDEFCSDESGSDIDDGYIDISDEFPEQLDSLNECYEEILAKQRKGMLTLEVLEERICSSSHDNGINVKANVRLEDTPVLINFTIPSILINRLGKYLLIGDQYDEEFIQKNNKDVLFISDNDQENIVPSDMPFASIDDTDQSDESNSEEERGCVHSYQ